MNGMCTLEDLLQRLRDRDLPLSADLEARIARSVRLRVAAHESRRARWATHWPLIEVETPGWRYALVVSALALLGFHVLLGPTHQPNGAFGTLGAYLQPAPLDSGLAGGPPREALAPRHMAQRTPAPAAWPWPNGSLPVQYGTQPTRLIDYAP